MICKETEKCHSYTRRRSGNRNVPWESPDDELSRQGLQSRNYKYVQRIKGNHALRSEEWYDGNVSSIKNINKGVEFIKKEPNENPRVETYITVTYMKNLTEGLTSRFELAEESTYKLEDRLIEIMKYERRKNEDKSTVSGKCMHTDINVWAYQEKGENKE